MSHVGATRLILKCLCIDRKVSFFNVKLDVEEKQDAVFSPFFNCTSSFLCFWQGSVNSDY